MLSHLLRELILPPCSLLALLVASWLLRNKKPRLATALFVTGCGLFALLSMPLISFWLTRTTEARPALGLAQVRAFEPQAVVVLGAGVDFDAVEYEGRSVPSASAQERLAYAAYLAKELGLPVITTGGYGDTPDDAEGQTAAWQLKQNGLKEVWPESQSRNTVENALLSKKVAGAHSVNRVVVVTQAGHAARAEAAFRHADLQAIVAPTGFRSRQPWERGILLFVPTHAHLNESCSALRAHLAQLYEILRGRG